MYYYEPLPGLDLTSHSFQSHRLLKLSACINYLVHNSLDLCSLGYIKVQVLTTCNLPLSLLYGGTVECTSKFPFEIDILSLF